MDATPQTLQTRGNQDGFLLIEVLVALVICGVVVVGIGLLTENLIHRRASADALSASVSLAQRQMEQLLALPNPATNAGLTTGVHGPCGSPPCAVGADGIITLAGPYLLQWTVIDNASAATPLIDATSSSKKLIVSVTHISDAYANAILETYYDYR